MELKIAAQYTTDTPPTKGVSPVILGGGLFLFLVDDHSQLKVLIYSKDNRQYRILERTDFPIKNIVRIDNFSALAIGSKESRLYRIQPENPYSLEIAGRWLDEIVSDCVVAGKDNTGKIIGLCSVDEGKRLEAWSPNIKFSGINLSKYTDSFTKITSLAIAPDCESALLGTMTCYLHLLKPVFHDNDELTLTETSILDSNVYVQAVFYCEGKEKIAIAAAGGLLRLVSLPALDILKKIRTSKNPPQSGGDQFIQISASTCSSAVLAQTREKNIIVWDLLANEENELLRFEADDIVSAIFISGSRIIVIARKRELQLVNIDRRLKDKSIAVHEDIVEIYSTFPDSLIFITINGSVTLMKLKK